MLPVSLDCPFFIAPSAFSNVYSVEIGSEMTILSTQCGSNLTSGFRRTDWYIKSQQIT